MPITPRHPYNESLRFLENRLRKSGERHGFTGRRLQRYIFGALNRMGAKRGSITTRKGAAMMAEHRVGARGELRKFTRKVNKRTRRRFGHVPRHAIRKRYPTRSERHRR